MTCYDVTSSNFPYMYAELDVSTDTVKIRCEQSGAMTDTSRTYYIPLGKIKFDSSKNFSEYVSYDLPQYVVFYWNDTEPSGFARKEKYGNCEAWKDDIVKLSESATAEIANAADYKTVWNLGDFITIKIELFDEMISFTRQITEVEENISASGTTVVPTFGQPKENIIRKLIKGRL